MEHLDVRTEHLDIRTEHPDIRTEHPDIRTKHPDVRMAYPDIQTPHSDVRMERLGRGRGGFFTLCPVIARAAGPWQSSSFTRALRAPWIATALRASQ
jgi:hypothetical protein